MRPPTPPKEMYGPQSSQLEEDTVEVERSETVEIILFEYEDENVSFNISFEFVYTFTQQFDTETLLS